MAKVKKYFWNLLIAFDQMLNAAAFGCPNETFSSRVHRKAEAGQWFWKALRRVVNAAFFRQKDHCLESFQSEQLRRHFPAELTVGCSGCLCPEKPGSEKEG